MNDPFGKMNDGLYNSAEHNKRIYGRDDEPTPGFGQLSTDRPHALRNRIVQLANSEGDAEVAKVLRDGGIAHEGDDLPHDVIFHLADGGTVTATLHRRGSEWSTVVTINGQPTTFKAADRDSLVGLVNRSLNPGSRFRDLTEAERLELAYLAGSGGLEETLNLYFQYRCGTANVDTHDPAFQQVANAAAWFVFIHSTPEFVDSSETRAYFHRHIGNRPVTLPLLKAAFRAWRKFEKNAPAVEPTQPAREPEPLVPDLESLSDTEIDELHTATLRSRAQNIRNALRL